MSDTQLRADDVLVCVFAKAPLPGRVKTRMQPQLSPQQAAALHGELLACCLDNLCRKPVCEVQLFAAGHHEVFEELAQQWRLPLSYQRGADLGERMRSAIDDGLERYSSVIVVGADCPFIDADYVRAAIDALRAGSEVVLGPALDGGYVLVGASRDVPVLFSDIPWGTAAVLDVSRQRLASAGVGWHELQAQPDIDRPEDLPQLAVISALAHWAELSDSSNV